MTAVGGVVNRRFETVVECLLAAAVVFAVAGALLFLGAQLIEAIRANGPAE